MYYRYSFRRLSSVCVGSLCVACICSNSLFDVVMDPDDARSIRTSELSLESISLRDCVPETAIAECYITSEFHLQIDFNQVKLPVDVEGTINFVIELMFYAVFKVRKNVKQHCHLFLTSMYM